MSGCASAPASRQPTGRAFSGPCPHSRRTCLDGNTTRSLEVSLKDTDGPDQKVTLQAWLGGRAHLLATSHERDLDHALAEVRRPDPPDRGREVAARTSQAPEDALSHNLTRPGMRLQTFPNREMSPRAAVRMTAQPVTDRLAGPRKPLDRTAEPGEVSSGRAPGRPERHRNRCRLGSQ